MKFKVGFLVLLSVFWGVYPRNRGLQNCGNSCFFNSSMQALSQMEEFNGWFKLIENPSQNLSIYTTLIKALRNDQEYSKLGLAEQALNRTTQITDTITLDSFYTLINPSKKQQDAQEFIINFINETLIKQISDEQISDLIKSLIEIQTVSCLNIASHAKCLGYLSYKSEFNNILSLSISNQKNPNLSDCLNEYFKREELDSQNYVQCVNCKTNVRTFKQIKILKFPKYLILSLKRFDRARNKISTPVSIPLTLKFDKNFQGLDALLKNIMPETINYELISFIVHSGSLDAGHYWAYGKDQANEWFRYEDANVTDVGNDLVFAKNNVMQTGLDDGVVRWSSGTPYILFFRLSVNDSIELEKIAGNLTKSNVKKQQFVAELSDLKAKFTELSIAKDIAKDSDYYGKLNAIDQTLKNWDESLVQYILTDFDRLYHDEFLPLKNDPILQPAKPAPEPAKPADPLVQKIDDLKLSVGKVAGSVTSVKENLETLLLKLKQAA